MKLKPFDLFWIFVLVSAAVVVLVRIFVFPPLFAQAPPPVSVHRQSVISVEANKWNSTDVVVIELTGACLYLYQPANAAGDFAGRAPTIAAVGKLTMPSGSGCQ
jgi:hypothetical protein